MQRALQGHGLLLLSSGFVCSLIWTFSHTGNNESRGKALSSPYYVYLECITSFTRCGLSGRRKRMDTSFTASQMLNYRVTSNALQEHRHQMHRDMMDSFGCLNLKHLESCLKALLQCIFFLFFLN